MLNVPITFLSASWLIQIMACCLFGNKPLPEPMITVYWTFSNKPQWNFNQNTMIFIWKNTFKDSICKLVAILFQPLCVNSLAPNDTIWQSWTLSTLFQVIAWCLMAPSYYLNQHWLVVNGILWHLSETNLTANSQDINSWNEFENHTCKSTSTSLRNQWVKSMTQILPCFRPHFIFLEAHLVVHFIFPTTHFALAIKEIVIGSTPRWGWSNDCLAHL